MEIKYFLRANNKRCTLTEGQAIVIGVGEREAGDGVGDDRGDRGLAEE